MSFYVVLFQKVPNTPIFHVVVRCSKKKILVSVVVVLPAFLHYLALFVINKLSIVWQ